MKDSNPPQTNGYLTIVGRYLKGRPWEEEGADHRELKELCGQKCQTFRTVRTRKVIQLPDDILNIIFQYLPLMDVIRCELVCCRFRDVIVHYSIYKSLLDSICRRKRINNYMALSDRAKENKTIHERSKYYKMRLYHYTNKFRLRVDMEDDAYIETYKVGKRKQDLDKLVQKSMKRFSLSGV